MKKLIIKVIGVILLVTFLIYLFYSPRLKFDVLENLIKIARQLRQSNLNRRIRMLRTLNLKKG